MRNYAARIGSRYFLLDRNPVRGGGHVSRRAVGLAVYLTFPILIAAACLFDHTFTMVDPAKGFTQHYGFWAIFATTPIILFMTSYLLYKFTNTICDVDEYCVDASAEVRRSVETLVRRHVESLGLRSRSVAILVMLVIGLLWWCILNVLNTTTPTDTYRHDVFDSYAHPSGFVVTKVYVFIVFAAAYAVAIFVAVHVTLSMISIMKYLRINKIFRIDLFHADNCGGLSRFGNINLLIMGIYINFFIVIFAMYRTHQTTYPVMLFSLIGSSVLAFAQSVVAVYHIHLAVAARKEECLEVVVERLNDLAPLSLPPKNRFPTELLALRNHVAGVSTFPYARGAAAAVNVIRFAPAAMAVVGMFTR